MKSMRTGLVFLLLALGASALSQTYKFRVSVGGQSVGTATITDKITVAGNMLTTVNISMKAGGTSITMQAAEEYRPDGMPVRTMSSMSSGGETDRSVVVYTSLNATITNTTSGKTTKKVAPLPKGSIKVPSIIWFRKGFPKVGTKISYWSLNSATVKWEQEYDKYASNAKIASRGKMVAAHLIESKEVRSWHDSKGGNIRLILASGGVEILLERV